jgi:4-amino-4-deoxy-L-arabinose transferase-like glycosyltransferase
VSLRGGVRTNRWLLAALVVGLAIRLPLFVHAQSDGLPGDQLQYAAQAVANAEGNWFEQPFDAGAPAAEHPPLTSTLLTPPAWVLDGDALQLAQRLVVLGFGMANIVLLNLLGRRWSPVVGSVAGLLAALDAHLFLSDVLILSETFGVTLVALLLLVLTAPGYHRRPLRSATGAGALLGLLLLTRPELTMLVPLVCLWRYLTSPGGRSPARLVRALVPGMVVAAVVAPWVLWNQVRFAESTILSTNDGFTLLGSNCPDTYFGDNIGGYSIFCALSVAGDPTDDASQVSAKRRDVALTYAREHIERLPLVVTARFVRQWELGFIGRTAGDSVGEGRPPALVLLGSVQWWLYGALAAVGMVRLARPWRWLLWLPPVVVTVSAVTVIAGWRMRLSAEPSVVVAAAVAAAALRPFARSAPGGVPAQRGRRAAVDSV